jgi:hypothetical protein
MSVRGARIVLVSVGIALFAICPALQIWPAGFRWQPAHPGYEQTITVIYAVLGIFLVRASRAPHRHTSLIWFTVWSSLAHAAIMAGHAVADPTERLHLVGDIPGLVIMATGLAVTARVTGRRPGTASYRCRTDPPTEVE